MHAIYDSRSFKVNESQEKVKLIIIYFIWAIEFLIFHLKNKIDFII